MQCQTSRSCRGQREPWRPSEFETCYLDKPLNPKEAAQAATADKEAWEASAAVISIRSAFGTYGAFLWPRLFGKSLHDWGSVRAAMRIALGVQLPAWLRLGDFHYHKGAGRPRRRPGGSLPRMPADQCHRLREPRDKGIG